MVRGTSFYQCLSQGFLFENQLNEYFQNLPDREQDNLLAQDEQEVGRHHPSADTVGQHPQTSVTPTARMQELKRIMYMP